MDERGKPNRGLSKVALEENARLDTLIAELKEIGPINSAEKARLYRRAFAKAHPNGEFLKCCEECGLSV